MNDEYYCLFVKDEPDFNTTRETLKDVESIIVLRYNKHIKDLQKEGLKDYPENKKPEDFKVHKIKIKKLEEVKL